MRVWRALEAAGAAAADNSLPLREYIDGRIAYSDALAHLGRFDDAERQFREELRYFPASNWAYASLANLYRAENRTADCDRVLDAMLQASPSSDAYSLAAGLLMKFGEPERAAALRRAARSRFGFHDVQ